MTDNGAPLGHIKLARKAFDTDHGDDFWNEPREFSRWEAWVDMIQLASFRDRRYQTEFGGIDLARGEFVASLRYLGSRWKWTVKRVRYFLATCEKGARLRAQRETPAGTVYVLVNYDTYQTQGHSKGTAEGTPEGTAGAQQGHKREAGKAVTTKTALSGTADEQVVLKHYLARHPRRRTGDKDRKAVTRALTMGYTAAELCAAIDGNANDPWHAGKHKHELPYVLRDTGNIDTFRARAESASAPIVDPETGLLTPLALERLA